MAYEDFTTYTEVDVPADRIQKTANHVDHYSHRAETTYLHSCVLYGVDHFGNFEHLIAARHVSGDWVITPWMLATGVGSTMELNAASEEFLYLRFYGAGGSRKISIHEFDGTSGYYDESSFNFTDNVWYYFTLKKVGTAFTCKIYSDSDRTNLLDTLSLNLQSDYSFQYIYPANCLNIGGTSYSIGDIDNLDIQEPTLYPSSIASAEAFGTLTVAPGPVSLSPSSIASGEVFGTPTVSLVPLGIYPSSIPSAETFGTPTLKYDQVITPTSVTTAEAFGSLTVVPGPVSVSPIAISSVEAFGTPFVCIYQGVTSHAVAACSYGAAVYLFRIGLDGHLYRRESADNGISWAAWVDMGDISGNANTRLACCFKDADEAIVLYSTGASLYRRRLSGGSWEAAAAWSNSLNSITGIAVTYMGDWNVAVTGTDTADCPGVWTCILGDGYNGAPGTWYSLNELMIAEYESGISYHFPTLDMPDVFRLFFIETYSGTEAYSMPFFTYSLPTADFIDNLWREPVPFNLSSEYGIYMAHAGGSVYLSCPSGYWSADLTPADVDLTDDLIGAHLSLKPFAGELELALRNDDGRYNSPPFTRGCDIRLKFGYHTTEGVETAGYLPIATIDSIECTLKKGRSVVTLHALDGWSLLYNWIARYQHTWAAGDKNVFQLLSFIFARAGIELSSYSTSSRITAYEPAFTIHPGERGITAAKRLLSLIEDVILFAGDIAYIIDPQSDDSAAYAYGVDHKVIECVTFDFTLSINLALTHSETIAVGNYRWSEINLVYDRLSKEFDDNIASAADAHLFGEAILREAELSKVAGMIIVPMNVALDLYDVVELTVPHLDITSTLYRLAGIDYYWIPEKGAYNQRLLLSVV